MSDDEYAGHEPKVLVMSEKGGVKETLSYKPGPAPMKPAAKKSGGKRAAVRTPKKKAK
jgi:hypothetical protein